MRANFQKIFSCLLVIFLLAPIHFSRAASWPAVDPLIKQALEKVQKQIDGLLLGAAKQASIKALQLEISALVAGGSSEGPMFVSDWQAYLVKQPQITANLYINDYISKITSGRGSISGYISNNRLGVNLQLGQNYEGVGPGSFAYGYGKIDAAQAQSFSFNYNAGSAGNYISQLVQGTTKLTTEITPPRVTYYENPSRMFADPKKGFKNLNLYLSGINNPWAFNMDVQSELEKKKTALEKEAQTKIIAGQGFLGKEADGRTITPGAFIKDQFSKVQGMGMDMIATAQNLPEVITAVVSMTISQTVQQGVGNIRVQVNKDISNIRSQATNQLNLTIQSQGPGALYKR